MKQFLAFLGLKIVEISAIVFVPYWIGLGFGVKDKIWITVVLFTVLFFACIVLLVFIFFLLLEFIRLNWKWTHKGKSIKWIDKILGE